MFLKRTVAGAACAVFCAVALAEEPHAQFLSFVAAQPVLNAMPNELPAALRGTGLTPAAWAEWLKTADAAVRGRLDRGEEDTLSNLLRFGVTFTQEYRIDDEYFLQFNSTLVKAFADHRASDLIAALAAPHPRAGFVEMRALLERRGFPLNTPASRALARQYLLRNLARLNTEFLQAREQAKTNRSQMFQNRGISLDTNLWPDYDLDLQLQRMAANGMLQPGSVRKVAIVGPGLDFANKQEGVDYYPPQTVQPFAVLDSLLRRGLAPADAIAIHTLDISALVNAHLASIRTKAARGEPYVVQLPWFAGGRWSDDFRSRFAGWWQGLGSQIGEPVARIPVPEAAAGFETRALRIRPEMVNRVHPIDMNIVYQVLPLVVAERYDLIIGTNIFLYYGAFEQSLARSNVAAMLRPGGYLLSNDKLAEGIAAGLDLVMTTEIPTTGSPVITDYIFCYRRRS